MGRHTVRRLLASSALLTVASVSALGQGTGFVTVAGLGSLAFPTSGSGAAQADFERGVLLMHSFQYAEAAAAFRKAQGQAPNFAMAYWGEALTHTHQVWNEQDLVAARRALGNLAPTPAARAAAAPTARERAYLEAVEALYGDGSKARRDTFYAAAMERLHAQFPSDDEAAILYATALFGLTQGVRDVPLYMRAGAIAQDVFRRNPEHPGAAHMVIHAFDDPVHAPLGLYAARRYSQIAPGAAHAQHMTTHIFLALGLWRDVAAQNVIASGADSAKWQIGHYTSWLVYARLQQGEYAAARAMLQSLAAHDVDGKRRGALANAQARYVLETGDWSGPEARALDAGIGRAGEDDYEYATFAAAYAAVKRGDRARAASILQRIATKNGASTRSVQPGDAGAKVVPVILELSLRAELLVAAGKNDSAQRVLRRAASLEDGMPPEFGPPAVVLPTHEQIGGLMAALGQPVAAAEQYTKALEMQPGRSAALLGLARAEAARGRASESATAYRQLADNWRDADITVTALTEARTRSANTTKP